MPDNIKDNSLNKDTSRSVAEYNPVLFHNDRDLFTVYKKVEAISSAVFLTTSLMPDSEVLKAKLREQALQALAKIGTWISAPSIQVGKFQELASEVFELSSLLDSAYWSGSVSQMNISVIQEEIKKLYELIDSLFSKYKSKFFIDANLFKDAEQDKGQISSQNNVFDHYTPYKGHIIKDIKDKQSNKGQNSEKVIKDNIKDRSREVVSETKNQRREVILKFLGDHAAASIKDIAGLIPDVSEKTLQRELLSLVAEGLVKKTGERRWSTYSLAS